MACGRGFSAASPRRAASKSWRPTACRTANIENHVTTNTTTLVYTPRMPSDAIISRAGRPFRFVATLGLMGLEHSYTLRGGGPFTCAYCVFGARFLAGLSEIENRLRSANSNLLAPIESERLTYLGGLMLREAVAPGFGGSLFAEAVGTAVAVEIARLDGAPLSEDERRGGGLASWQMRRLESYVREHLSDDLTLNELALLIGVGVRQLSRAIKKAKGVGLRRWTVERRIAEARRLLIETDLPIQDIAPRCAFQSAAAFSAAFRAVAGCAPSVFRRLALGL